MATERLRMISFRVDGLAYEALQRLETAEVTVIHRRKRSAAIRRAILEADQRLIEHLPKKK